MEDLALSTASAAASVGGFENMWAALAQSARVEGADAADVSSHDYHPELATPELIVQIRRLLAAERRAGRLVCRYLADLADRIHGQRDRDLLAYEDEFQAAACFFELGAREVRERVRIGRALRQLPRIEAAFIAGELSYSRVREVTRVAQPDTESAWLECARDLDMRALERRVAGTPEPLVARQNQFDETSAEPRGVADGPSREQARLHIQWLDDGSLRVTFELPAEAWALLERALEGARQKAATPLADAEALAAVARDALESQNQAADALDGENALAPSQRAPQSNGADDDIDAGTTHLGMLNEDALRLLRIMGRRSRWTADVLLERSALAFPELQHALLLLELAGRVRRRGCEFDPV